MTLQPVLLAAARHCRERACPQTIYVVTDLLLDTHTASLLEPPTEFRGFGTTWTASQRHCANSRHPRALIASAHPSVPSLRRAISHLGTYTERPYKLPCTESKQGSIQLRRARSVKRCTSPQHRERQSSTTRQAPSNRAWPSMKGTTSLFPGLHCPTVSHLHLRHKGRP